MACAAQASGVVIRPHPALSHGPPSSATGRAGRRCPTQSLPSGARRPCCRRRCRPPARHGFPQRHAQPRRRPMPRPETIARCRHPPRGPKTPRWALPHQDAALPQFDAARQHPGAKLGTTIGWPPASCTAAACATVSTVQPPSRACGALIPARMRMASARRQFPAGQPQRGSAALAVPVKDQPQGGTDALA